MSSKNKKPVDDDKVILEFPVLWSGWECDDKGWVMERPNKERYIRMTNHGTPYTASVKELNDHITEYEGVIAQTKAAIAALT